MILRHNCHDVMGVFLRVLAVGKIRKVLIELLKGCIMGANGCTLFLFSLNVRLAHSCLGLLFVVLYVA